MQFRTRIPVPESSQPVGYSSQIVSLGSCFAVNIGAKFDYFKFRSSTNPFGILFHPLALEKAVGFAVNRKTFTEADIFFHNGRWHCFDVHSDLSHPEKEVVLNNLNTATQQLREGLANATHFILTPGTAWVYRNKETNALVANCHKVPQKQFTKEILAVDAIITSLTNIVTLAKQLNPSVHIIFTVSPVRHIKDGFVENQRSKAHLIAALQKVLETNENTGYFPSYEIVMDELRDYRFYAEDMVHPNAVAIDYIWERFTETHIEKQALPVMKEVDGIQKGLQHRPFNPDSDDHRDFVAKLNNRINGLKKDYPHISFNPA